MFGGETTLFQTGDWQKKRMLRGTVPMKNG
jgi:hypothetical protein